MKKVIFSIFLIILLICPYGCAASMQDIQQKLGEALAEVDRLQREKAAWQTEKIELNKKIEELNNKLSTYVLKNPTYAEAVAFIKEDNSDKEIPKDFALASMLAAENARKKGLNPHYVVARTVGNAQWGNMGYHFFGFNTVDRGWIYFCATDVCADQETRIEIGKKLSVTNPSWGYLGIDDTVISIHYLPF